VQKCAELIEIGTIGGNCVSRHLSFIGDISKKLRYILVHAFAHSLKASCIAVMVIERRQHVNLKATALFETTVLTAIESGPTLHLRLTHRTFAFFPITVGILQTTNGRLHPFNRYQRGEC
jgi:hypothetical protein